MSYKETVKLMLDRGLIKKQKIDFKQIEALLFRAKKDLIAAKANLEIEKRTGDGSPFLFTPYKTLIL
jgi:hypothetical protein